MWVRLDGLGRPSWFPSAVFRVGSRGLGRAHGLGSCCSQEVSQVPALPLGELSTAEEDSSLIWRGGILPLSLPLIRQTAEAWWDADV